MPTFTSSDAEHVWRQLSHKCSRLDRALRELEASKHDPRANAGRIDRQIDATDDERRACRQRLEVIAAGGPLRRPAAEEDFRLLAAIQRVDVASRLGWAAVLTAADELVRAYPAAFTQAHGPPRRETFGGAQPSSTGPR